MQTYSNLSYELSRALTDAYTSSFGLSSRLFSRRLRKHIYAIYGLVRIADEVVDTYGGPDQREILDSLEQETYAAMDRGYSVNPLVQAFAESAKTHQIDKELIAPFFASMRMDINNGYTTKDYELYIYGSANVVGLMCLRVFSADVKQYRQLKSGAMDLASAYQKVNFLRDISHDYQSLGRVYFPGVVFETFDDPTKQKIEREIQQHFDRSRQAVNALPSSSRYAVATSYAYYRALLQKIAQQSAEIIKQRRIRISGLQKIMIMAKTIVQGGRV